MFDTIKNLITTVGNELLGLVNPIAIVAMIACGILWVISSDPQTVQKAKSWLFRIAIGIAVANLAVSVVNLISNSTNGVGANGGGGSNNGQIVDLTTTTIDYLDYTIYY